ncbi:hypothetical protein [Luteimonas sp. 3794]|uniref:hypothetical protein n=1 Tax=Luteimonas sp. 3794 TaxID=2817730 RepID=UPI00285A617A|nr:hypothetical protein [Luteimonas sp. 3794]MDR6992458.1 hypothetical protein [Luteimonas sp. 3794]
MTEQEDLDRTMAALSLSRQILFHALAGYRLMAEPEQPGAVHTLHVREDAITFLPFDSSGTSYRFIFQCRDLTPWADRVVKQVARQMVISSIHDTWGFAIRNRRKDELANAPALLMARHMRNAYVHDGGWRFESSMVEPLKWKNRELRRDMVGQDPDELITLQDKLQMCAEFQILLLRAPGYEHSLGQ